MIETFCHGGVDNRCLMVEAQTETYTYRELVTAVSANIQHIQSHCAKGPRILYLASQGVATVIGLLSAMSVGTVLPINPARKLDHILMDHADFTMDLILYDASDAVSLANDLAKAFQCPALLVATQSTSNSLVDNAVPSPTLDSVVLILRTSGTTGLAKFVPLTLANIRHNVAHMVKALPLCQSLRYLSVMPLYHIHGIMVMLTVLASEGTVVFDETVQLNMAKAMEIHGIQWTSMAPTFLHALLSTAMPKKASDFPQLQFIRSCSSPLSLSLYQSLQDKFQVPIYQAYGMTEATHQVTSGKLSMPMTDTLSVGQPTVEVLDIVNDQGESLPVGVKGEVVIGGPNVFSGYLFTDHHQDYFHGQLFRTGDLGYLDLSGHLYLTGRLKEQINKGGTKISPNEIDNLLLQLEDVKEAASFSMPHPTLGEDIGIAIIPAKNTTENAIRAKLSQLLPGYLQPLAIYLVDSLPKNDSGKVLRQTLRDRFLS